LKDLAVAGEAVKGVEVVFHLAANPEVRIGEVDPCWDGIYVFEAVCLQIFGESSLLRRF